MATDRLTAQQITKKLDIISKIVRQLEDNDIAAFFFMQSFEQRIYYGDKAIERYINENIDDIVSQPDFRQTVEPSQIVKDRIINEIDQLRAKTLKSESEMNMMEMRKFAAELMQAAAIRNRRGGGLYHVDNKPSWFTSPIWQPMNHFQHAELRSIIASCYEFYGLDYQVYPCPDSPRTTSRERKKTQRAAKNMMSQWADQQTQTTSDDPPVNVVQSPLSTDTTVSPVLKRKFRDNQPSRYQQTSSVLATPSTSSLITLHPVPMSSGDQHVGLRPLTPGESTDPPLTTSPGVAIQSPLPLPSRPLPVGDEHVDQSPLPRGESIEPQSPPTLTILQPMAIHPGDAIMHVRPISEGNSTGLSPNMIAMADQRFEAAKKLASRQKKKKAKFSS